MKPSTFLYFSCFSHMEEKSFSRKQKKFSHNLTSCFLSPPGSGLWTYYSVQSSKLWHHDLFFNSFLLQDSSFKSLFQSSVWWFQWRQMKHLTCVKCWERQLPEINLICRNVINININQSRPAPGFTPFVVWLALFTPSSSAVVLRHSAAESVRPTDSVSASLSQNICMTELDGNAPPFAFPFACLLKIWLECKSKRLLTPERLNKALTKRLLNIFWCR